MLQTQRVQIENEGNQPEENKYELNPDHSHFIVVRDSTISKTGINYFLLKLEQYLALPQSHYHEIDATGNHLKFSFNFFLVESKTQKSMKMPISNEFFKFILFLVA